MKYNVIFYLLCNTVSAVDVAYLNRLGYPVACVHLFSISVLHRRSTSQKEEEIKLTRNFYASA